MKWKEFKTGKEKPWLPVLTMPFTSFGQAV